MAQPVVHFEIIGSDPQALRNYYGQLFGWQYDTGGVVADRVSDPNDYGFVDQTTTDAGVGIPGGVGGGPTHRPRAMFYVGVADVETVSSRPRASAGGGCSVLSRRRAGHRSDCSPTRKAT